MAYAEITATEAGTTDWITLGTTGPGNYSIVVDITDTLTYDVEWTNDKVITGSESVVQHSVLNTKSADAASNLVNTPVSAFRLNVTSYTSGTATLKVRSADK